MVISVNKVEADSKFWSPSSRLLACKYSWPTFFLPFSRVENLRIRIMGSHTTLTTINLLTLAFRYSTSSQSLSPAMTPPPVPKNFNPNSETTDLPHLSLNRQAIVFSFGSDHRMCLAQLRKISLASNVHNPKALPTARAYVLFPAALSPITQIIGLGIILIKFLRRYTWFRVVQLSGPTVSALLKLPLKSHNIIFSDTR